jgi:hypothetical protein
MIFHQKANLELTLEETIVPTTRLKNVFLLVTWTKTTFI